MLTRFKLRCRALDPWQAACVLAVLPLTCIGAWVLLWAFTRHKLAKADRAGHDAMRVPVSSYWQ